VAAPSAPSGGDDQVAGGTVYVVSTPIGNLADVTLRALEVLAAVPLIAAEDTRITRRLLARHGIEGRLVSFHARSGAARLAELLAHLRRGADLAVVTDAGTPGVSDPGEELVAAWAAEDGRVVPIPGASAVLAAVAVSGIAGPQWAFEGFLPRGGRERRRRLARIAGDERATILFEAPTRLEVTLRDLAEACGPARRAAVCRELTKLHEQVVRGTLEELIGAVDDGTIPRRGEIALVVGGHRPRRGQARSSPPASPGDVAPRDESQTALDEARAAVDALVAAGLARGEASRRVSEKTGLPRRALYRVDRDAS
jgi:16S rRNA (cytidine1402-2'-O)-methyltransferase